MPNTKGGKGYKRGKKGNRDQSKREMPYASNDNKTRYAQVTGAYGTNRVQVTFDQQYGGETSIGLIPGKFKKKVWIRVGDILLVETHPISTTECNILHKYNAQEATNLKSQGLLNFTVADDIESSVKFGNQLDKNDEEEVFEQMADIGKENESENSQSEKTDSNAKSSKTLQEKKDRRNVLRQISKGKDLERSQARSKRSSETNTEINFDDI